MEFSVISEKFQKFQINNRNYPKPRYQRCGNFREISIFERNKSVYIDRKPTFETSRCFRDRNNDFDFDDG